MNPWIIPALVLVTIAGTAGLFIYSIRQITSPIGNALAETGGQMMCCFLVGGKRH